MLTVLTMCSIFYSDQIGNCRIVALKLKFSLITVSFFEIAATHQT